jgi:uncharacterized protein DUF3551
MTPKLRPLLMAGLLAGAAFAPSASQAQGYYAYPYCVQGHDYGWPGDCSFSSYEQCMATASGTLNSCGINPRFAFRQPDIRPQRHRRHW